MFFGEYRHNMDAKGRLSIPAKFRNQCQEIVYVAREHDGCLSLYTEEGWQRFYTEQIANLSKNKKDARTFIRLLGSRVSECEFDKLGRINIPASLREEANLEKECVIVGVGDNAEIWDSKKWDAFYKENRDHFDDISEEME